LLARLDYGFGRIHRSRQQVHGVPTHYPEEMAKPKLRPRRDVTVNSPYQEARDEMFQQIMQCGVIGCHPDDQKEWFDATISYLAGRYPELKPTEVTELRTLGERFAQPPKAKAQEVAGV
jgi:hypothetical protein